MRTEKKMNDGSKSARPHLLDRLVRRLCPIRRVHHIVYSYGWVIPFFKLGYFERYGVKKVSSYHDCTATGIY